MLRNPLTTESMTGQLNRIKKSKMVQSNVQAANIIIEFTHAYQLFRQLFSQASGYIFNRAEINNSVDEIYRRLNSDICSNLLEPLKNKNLSLQSFDTSTYYQSVVDSFIFNVSSLVGFQICLDKAFEIVNRVETATIEDICEFIPFIDDSKLSIKEYRLLPHNSALVNIVMYNE